MFLSINYIDYKIKGDRKTLSIEEYLKKIRPYIKDIINNLKKSDSCKTQLTIAINFISSKDDNDETQVMHSKSDDIEIMVNDEADKYTENFLNHSKTDIKII